jgi:hypothetical protein
MSLRDTEVGAWCAVYATVQCFFFFRIPQIKKMHYGEKSREIFLSAKKNDRFFHQDEVNAGFM